MWTSQQLLGALLTAFAGLNVQVDALRVPRHATVVTRDVVNQTTYDFVIAGGGIAGLTVADRLTENPNVKVLVIEAGPFDHGEDSVLVPGAYNPFPYLWPNLFTVPQTGLNNQVEFAVCGKVVGGGSTVNAMVFLRGSVGDYASWAALGNPDWTWDSFLPYFKKSETFTPPSPSFAAAGNISYQSSVHGTSGPVQATYPNYFFPGSGYFWTAALNTGVTPAADPNNGASKGIFWFPSAEDPTSRTRSYARINHYQRVIASRPNYHLLAENTVAKVLFQGTQAVGVQYLPSAGGSLSTVNATKEVILAAGALHTPQILQLSGVGPQALLQSFGIPVVSNLPGVGQNFQDQPTIPMSFNFTHNVQPNWDTLLNNATYDAQQRAIYDSSKTGPYTLVRGLSTNFISLPLKDVTSSYLSIAAAAAARNPLASLPAGTDSTVAAGYVAQRALLLAQLADDVSVGGLHWSTGSAATLYALKPFSRGTVNINGTDPLANPIIDFRAATDPTDIAVNIALLRKMRAIFAAPPMAGLGPVETGAFAGLTTDAQLEAAMRSVMSPTNGHECCTAAMMPRALGGVLDNQMRVYGVSRLRVIDISYWPFPISGAPSATMYATGEKIADVIKQAYGL